MIPSLTSAARQRAAAGLAATCGMIAACGLIAACGSTPAPAGGTPPAQAVTSAPGSAASTATSTSGTAAPSASPTATSAAATQARLAGCLASGLQAQLGAGQGTAGTIYQVIVLTNTSASSCTLYGYPGVSFVTGAGGTQVGAPATRNHAVAATLLTLVPGGKANALLAIHDAGAFPDCKLTSADWLRIYPPGDYGSLEVQYNAQTCANPANPILTVTAVAAGAGSAS
jgi:hypothetical protein